jgi:hypothetical protein
MVGDFHPQELLFRQANYRPRVLFPSSLAFTLVVDRFVAANSGTAVPGSASGLTAWRRVAGATCSHG